MGQPTSQTTSKAGSSAGTPAIALYCSQDEAAQEAATLIRPQIPHEVPVAEADIVIALGGDGTMLEVLHATMGQGIPVFGMNRGTVGFLLNDYHPEGLMARIEAAQQITLHPLRMVAKTETGAVEHAYAINEVSLLRETRQAAKLRIAVDGITRMDELVCDGALVATPAGSTAYNLSAQGPILPLESELLTLTPLSPFRPRRWRGALLPHTAQINIEVLEPSKRPVSAVADSTEIRDIVSVEITEDHETQLNLLFDPDQNLSERILKEQFAIS
ncbi:MAG: NAD kinase [Alphaproteobacteria bacterium]|nr:NAD kinase [Alphaproteobacteria bacterium SS10]